MKAWHALLYALVAMLTSGPLHAGPPYNVDDPGTAELRHYEINAAFTSTQVQGSEQQSLPDVEVNYGYNDKLQLTFDLGAISDRENGEQRRTGFDDTILEIKWRFQEETAFLPQIAVNAHAKLPTADANDGLGTGRMDEAAGIILGKSYSRWSLFADAGYDEDGSSEQLNNAYWGFAVKNQISTRGALGAQIYGNGSAAPGTPAEVAYGVAIEQMLAPDRIFIMQVGRSTMGLSDLNVYCGLQLVYGPKSVDGHD